MTMTYTDLFYYLFITLIVHESCIHHHVLHGDISLNNIILVERERNFCREGYLIDFDYASMYSSESSDAKGDQTVCPFFICLVS